MLVNLTISNFAIIKHLDIRFNPGLNILSGETGAGKSIIINAVNLILGGRASSDLIRSGAKEAKVEALFSFPKNAFLGERLNELGFGFDGEVVIKRTVSREGRNTIRINDSMATLQSLSRIADALLSISGQHEHQLLLKPENHLYLLDGFGELGEERNKFKETFDRFQSVQEKIAGVEEEIRRGEESQELSRFQIQEIESAAITLGEDEALLEEKSRLEHAEELLEIISGGYETLYEAPDSVISSLSNLGKDLEKGAGMDPGLSSIKKELEEALVRLEDAAFGLRDSKKTIQVDPQRLEQVVERIEVLTQLKRKYGNTLEEVLKCKEDLASRVEDLDGKRQELARLKKERDEIREEVIARALDLSQKRKATAQRLAEAIEDELRNLHMADTRFQVRFQQEGKGHSEAGGDILNGLGPEGLDRVEFMISPNVGEELRPLSRIASGGELSRIMLALKTILARTSSVETVIFDEVDAGIGGATAEVIGEKLLSLSQYHQILCITHLPQIASSGQTHFVVTKEVVDGRTQTMISGLDPEERVHEVARLLAGKEISSQALAHAREMIEKHCSIRVSAE